MDVASTTEPHVVVLPDAQTWLRWSQSHGMRAAWETVPERRHPELSAALVEQVERLHDPDGHIRLQVAVRVTTARRPAS